MTESETHTDAAPQPTVAEPPGPANVGSPRRQVIAIAVVAFVYNGGEGASVAGPILWQLLNAYFELRSIDNALETS